MSIGRPERGTRPEVKEVGTNARREKGGLESRWKCLSKVKRRAVREVAI